MQTPITNSMYRLIHMLSLRLASCRILIGEMSEVSPERRRRAMMMLAASDGWYGSQNTYLERSIHTLEDGPHGISPPTCPTTVQHGIFSLSKPAILITFYNTKYKYIYTLELVN